MLRPHAALVFVLVATLPPALAAQAPTVRAGVTAGVVKFGPIRSEQALTTTLEYDPNSWLTVSVIPSAVRIEQMVTTTGKTVSRSGIGDLPVSVDALYTFPTGVSPSLAGGVTFAVPTGSCGFGSGVTSVGVDAGIGIQPSELLRLSADASRSLTGGVSQSAFMPAQATWVSSDASFTLSDRWTASLSYGQDFGAPDSTSAHELGGGLSYALAGHLSLTFDATHGLTHASPRWVVSIGFGSAFTGTSPVTPTAPLRRLSTTFAGSKTAASATSVCR